MKTLHKTFISIITVAVLGITGFAQPTNADTNTEFQSRLTSITKLVTLAQSFPAYRGQIISLVAKALQELSKDIKDMDDNEEEINDDQELEIEVEIKKNKAYVEIEINGKDYKRTYNETNHNEIIEMIAEDFDLDDDDVRDAISFENEDEDNSKDIEVSSKQNSDGTVGTFTFEFSIKATKGDAKVNLSNTLSTILGDTSGDETYSLINLDGDAEDDGANAYIVSEGDENTFSYTVTIDPAVSGNYYVRLNKVGGIGVNELAGPENLDAN